MRLPVFTFKTSSPDAIAWVAVAPGVPYLTYRKVDFGVKVPVVKMMTMTESGASRKEARERLEKAVSAAVAALPEGGVSALEIPDFPVRPRDMGTKAAVRRTSRSRRQPRSRARRHPPS